MRTEAKGETLHIERKREKRGGDDVIFRNIVILLMGTSVSKKKKKNVLFVPVYNKLNKLKCNKLKMGQDIIIGKW